MIDLATIEDGAVISGPYRYALQRKIADHGLTALVIMVNPSTADALEDDQTIRKVKGFGARHGWARIMVGNLFAFRATDVKEVALAEDPVGPLNDQWLTEMIRQADVIVVAWGASAKLPRRLRTRWRAVAALCDQAGKPRLFNLGRCKDGHPSHPQMTGYNVPLTLWDRPL